MTLATKLFGTTVLVLAFMVGCSPTGYDAWPEQMETFPWVYTPDPDRPDFVDGRWETEDWDFDDGTRSGYYLEKLLNYYKTTSPEVSEHFTRVQSSIPTLGEGVVISFVGDLLPIVDNHANFADAIVDVVSADYRVANLETPTSPGHPIQSSGAPPKFNEPVELLDGLPFDLLQLNNNHSYDVGDEGIAATKQEVLARGMETTGLDEHALVTVKDTQIGFLSYTWGLNGRDDVSTHELFIVPFGHIGEDIDLSTMGTQIAAMKERGAEYIVLLLHWGFEYEYYPEPHFMQLARRMVAMGADVIIGHGPHVVQPVEVCWVNHPDQVPGVGNCSIQTSDGRARRAAIFYSLGNFTSSIRSPAEFETGIVGRVSLSGGDVTGLGWTPISVKYDPTEVVPTDDNLDDANFAQESERLNSHLGAAWRLP